MAIRLTISLPKEAIHRLRKEYRESGAMFGLTTEGFDRWMAEVKLAELGIERWISLPDEEVDTEQASDD